VLNLKRGNKVGLGHGATVIGYRNPLPRLISCIRHYCLLPALPITYTNEADLIC